MSHRHDEKCECGCPGPDEFYAGTAHLIEKHGQSVVGVMAGRDAFSYTIGNHEKGLPELLMFGDPRTFTPILNHIADLMREGGKPFEDGQLVDLGGRFPVKAVRCSALASEEYAIQAHRYYGVEPAEVAVIQFLVPDTHGRFPGEPGCEKPYADQKVLAAEAPAPGHAP
jgi:hypothetical protein